MIEVYPKKINEENVKASLSKLVAAFLDVAEDMVRTTKNDETNRILEDENKENELLNVLEPVFQKDTSK